jgi:hypothetical protein
MVRKILFCIAAAAVLLAATDLSARKAAPAARGPQPSPVGGATPPDPIFADGFEPASIAIATVQPADGSVIAADLIPRIAVRYSAGANPRVRLVVDGTDVTDKAQINADGVSYVPQTLAEMRHVVNVQVNGAGATWSFTSATAPLVRQAHPDELHLDSGARPAIGANYGDVGSGIDLASVRLLIDGSDVTAQAEVGATAIEYRPKVALADGTHFVTLRVSDLAGNASEAKWSFDVGAAPDISELQPPDGSSALVGGISQISADYGGSSAPVDAAGIRLYVDGDDVTARAVITPVGSGAGRVVYAPSGAFAAGHHTVELEVSNRANQSASAQWSFDVEAAAEYTLDFLAPAPDAVLLDARVLAKLRVGSTRGRPESVSVNGVAAYYQGQSDGSEAYVAPLTLLPGSNTLNAEAHFADGSVRSATRTVSHDAPPRISVTSPRDWQTFGPVDGGGAPVPGGATNLSGAVERPVTVSGTVSRPVGAVTINQQQAQLAAGGTQFEFPRFFLHEGTNLLSVNATDEHGRSGSAQLTVYVDQTAPLISIEAPLDKAVTSAARIDVRGVVNDAVEAGVNAPEPTVVVRNAGNGAQVAAAAADRYYLGRDLPLEVGANTVTVTATDAAGNARSRSVQVTRTAAGSRRITLLSGDRQAAPIGTELAQPLAVAAFDAEGQPLAGLPVRFDLLRGSGHISSQRGQIEKPDGTRPARNLVVATDDNGRAEIWWTVGTESSESGNMLRAWNEQIAEDVVFSATGRHGVPKYVLANGLAGSQYAQIDSQPVEPLTVRVMDAEFNAVAAARVRYRIVFGDARFDAVPPGGSIGADGSELVVNSDKDGLATARPQLGSRSGNVRVEAAVLLEDGSEIGPAALHLVVLQRQDGPTRFGGIVLDHTGTPLRGVRLSIGRTSLSAISDAAGKFQFDDQVPPGKIDLFVDGRDVQLRRGSATLQYPALHFETAVIQGQQNQLPHPIYLPPVDTARAQIVGGDEDVTLSVPGYEGFRMVVKAHSVTFPDGSHVGPLVVTPVNADRLPMVPPGPSGSFGALAWTLQPTGTRFDPPVQVHIPNTSGMLPGETLAIVQWDHDLATFVPMGRGTVDESGTTIVSDAGSGITKAGWGGGPPPIPPNCGDNPPADSCPADTDGDGFKALRAECSTCGACKKPQPATPGNCSETCVPKTMSELRFTIDAPTSNATVEIKTTTAEPEDKLFDLKVGGLDDDDSKTWAFKARTSFETGKKDKYKKHDCTVTSDAQPFSGASAEAKIKDFSFAADGAGAKLKMLTDTDAEITVKGCALKEEKRTFKTKMLNPTQAEVKAYARQIQTGTHPGTADGNFDDIKIADTLIRFMCHETENYGGYKQFATNGMPVLNGRGDGGIGILQVTDPDKRTCASVWDWRSNIVAGDQIFAVKLGDASIMHSREYRNDGPAKQCLSESPIPRDEQVDPPPLHGVQILYEAIRRNNGGRFYRFEPNWPYMRCNEGRWVRYLQIENPQNPRYVEDICKCDSKTEGDLVPVGCLHEKNAIMEASPAIFYVPPTPSLSTYEGQVVFKARKDNELDVEIMGDCDIVKVDGGAASDPDYFTIVQNLSPVSTVIPPSNVSPPVKIRFSPIGESRPVLAALRCFTRPPGRPQKALVPLRVLPPSFASRPAAGATLALGATGKAKLVLVNDYRSPRLGTKPIDSNGQALNVSLDGLSDPVSVTPAAASISSDKEIAQGATRPSNEKEFEVECRNATNQVVTQTLTVSHNGIAPGPVGPVTFTVTCAAAPQP